MQRFTSAADNTRSLRVDGLPRMMDAAVYLFDCFHENVEVLATTVLRNRGTGLPEDYGFVEFASHSDAEFVLESYNGERMPNFNNERYCLSWDTHHSGTRWRWDYTYELCSFFGYDEIGGILDAKTIIEQHKKSIPYHHHHHHHHHQLQTQQTVRIDEKEKEKELYLCFEEVNNRESCFVFRTIRLSELLKCSCDFSDETRSITKCEHCALKTKHESQLRQRAWLFTCGGKEKRIPKRMGCLASGSRMFFAGGVVPPPKDHPQTSWSLMPSSGDVYSFEAVSTVWQKLDWSFLKGKPSPLLFEVNRNLYCIADRPITSPLEHPTFEVYDSRSRECLVLPQPMVSLSSRKLACAVVGTKILISRMAGSSAAQGIPIMCFDVNEKEKKWRAMTSLFDGKPFPFTGRALVLDSNGTHVMFSFHDIREIYLSRLSVNDEGDISILFKRCVGVNRLVRTLMENVAPLSYAFVDLGEQKVAFVLCGNVPAWGKINGLFIGKVRVVVVVMNYEVYPDSIYVRSEILATRKFEYNSHSPYVNYTDLTGGLVV